MLLTALHAGKCRKCRKCRNAVIGIPMTGKNKQNRKRPGSPGLQSYSTIMYDGTVRAPFRVVRDQKTPKICAVLTQKSKGSGIPIYPNNLRIHEIPLNSLNPGPEIKEFA